MYRFLKMAQYQPYSDKYRYRNGIDENSKNVKLVRMHACICARISPLNTSLHVWFLSATCTYRKGGEVLDVDQRIVPLKL